MGQLSAPCQVQAGAHRDRHDGHTQAILDGTSLFPFFEVPLNNQGHSYTLYKATILKSNSCITPGLSK